MIPGVDQLRDIQGIGGVPWWPPAVGWWVVAGAILLLLALAWRWRTLIRLRLPPLPVFNIGSWRWDAARQLRTLRGHAVQQDIKQTAGELSELIRRIAMARRGRDACAGLTGEDWLDWLKGNDPAGFDWTAGGRLLLEAPYAPPGVQGRQEELLRLIDAAEAWVVAEEPKRA
jgi:hypothetical protein